MAKSAVDRIVEREGREAPCRTHEIPIGQPEDHAALPEVPGVDEASRVHLAARYGHAARDVLRLAAAAPAAGHPHQPGPAGHHRGGRLRRRPRAGALARRRAAAPHAAGAARRAQPVRGPTPRAPAGRRGRSPASSAGTTPASSRSCTTGPRSRGWRAWCRPRCPRTPAASPRRATRRRCGRPAPPRRRRRERPRAHGDRERDARLVLRSPGPQAARRTGRARSRAGRGGRRDRRRRRRVGAHRPRAGHGRARRAGAWCR